MDTSTFGGLPLSGAGPGTHESAVTQRLNALRIQGIRRARNADSRRHALVSIPRYTFNDPSLPVIVSAEGGRAAPEPRAAPILRTIPGRGHAAPASWTTPRKDSGAHSAAGEATAALEPPPLSTPIGRFNVMKLMWDAEGVVPLPLPPSPSDDERGPESLVHLALSAIFDRPEYLAAGLTTFPHHLRTLASRYAAVHAPEVFSPSFLVDVYVDDDGQYNNEEEVNTTTFFDAVSQGDEANYIGDGTSFQSIRRYLEAYEHAVEDEDNERVDWDQETQVVPSSFYRRVPSINPLTSLHLVNVPLQSVMHSTSSLPPTLQRLSLTSLTLSKVLTQPTIKFLKLLAKRLPLLKMLDVSFNGTWLKLRDQCQEVDWRGAWPCLTVLAARRRACSDVRWIDEDGSDEEMKVVWDQVNSRRPRSASNVRIAY